MAKSNFERMIQMAEDVFAAKNDPDQLDVDEKIIEQLQKLHPSTVSEFDDGNGPVVWILLIPTSLELMNKFIEKKITEKELLDLTPANSKFETIYLCSAMTLPEYRCKGMTQRLTLEAIQSIRKTNPIQNLFVWPFSNEGDALATSIALKTELPLIKRED